MQRRILCGLLILGLFVCPSALMATIAVDGLQMVYRVRGNPDEFHVVAMDDIAAGEVFYMTTNGWTGTEYRNTVNDEDGDERLSRTTILTPISKGTILILTPFETSGAYETDATSGEAVFVNGVGDPRYLPLDVDFGQVYGFQASAPLDPLRNVTNHIFAWDTTNGFEPAVDNDTGADPTGGSGVTFDGFTVQTHYQLDWDDSVLDDYRQNGATRAQWLAEIQDPAHWVVSATVTNPRPSSLTILEGPELSVATDIPAAELETVAVPVELSNASNVAATTFSIDYDETCLSFDETDANPVDGLPDAIAVHVPADFAVTVFHDLGDSDGELDISITDLAPPIATLAEGDLLTVTFTSTCSPALGATLAAPVDFSASPSASFSNDLAQDLAGSTSDGSVEVFPGPRGDCNSTGALSAADLIADALEIFDGDGTFWADAPGSTFVGSPVGCDANADTNIDAGDISCINLLIFGGTCGGAPFAGPGAPAFGPNAFPQLVLEAPYRDARGTTWVPLRFASRGHAISSLAFSLDLVRRGMLFDPFDGDGDGAPDSVRFPNGRPDLVDVRFDGEDRDGEIDLVLARLGDSFEDGVLVEIAVWPTRRGLPSGRHPLRFADAPAASFGALGGFAVPGQALEQK